MKIAAYVLAAAIGGLGLLFIVGAQGQGSRLVVGGVLIAAGIALVVAMRLRPQVIEQRVVQRIDVAGPTQLQKLTCQSCGATLDHSALKAEHGVAMVTCPFCKASYQLTEDPKW